MRPYTINERPRCQWIGRVGVAAIASRDNGKRQLVVLLIDILPLEPLRDVSRRAWHGLGLHVTIRDG